MSSTKGAAAKRGGKAVAKRGGKASSKTTLGGARNTKAKGSTTRSGKPGAARRQAPASRARVAVAAAIEPRMDIRELNPQEKCGPDTSVQFLYRVIERGERGPTNHLVFFDQHGWYCEHGRSCPAVAPAKKHSGWAARG